MRESRNSAVIKRRGFLFIAILIFTPVVNGTAISVPDYRISFGGTKYSDTLQIAAAFKLDSPQIFSVRNMELAIGTVSSRTNNEGFLSFGPTWRWPLGNQQSYVDFGFSPTLFTGSSFNGRELGGNFHFTSSISLGTRFGHRGRTSVSLRIQHTSNGGLRKPNPGMDMIGFEFSFNALE